MITEEFLASVGGPHDRSEITANLDRIEDWYVGDGWYTDGDGQNYDFYAGWAMQLYPLLWCRISGDTQRLASGNLRHFVDRGASDGAGLRTLGWYGEYLPRAQPYSGPASPSWASKAFLGLLLPAGHPVWTAPEERAPSEIADHTLALPAPGWLIQSTRADGVVRLLNHGSDRARKIGLGQPEDPHYARLSYSTHTAPQTGGDQCLRRARGSAVPGVAGPSGGGTALRVSVVRLDGQLREASGRASTVVEPVAVDIAVAVAVAVDRAGAITVCWGDHRVEIPGDRRRRRGGEQRRPM